MLVGNNLLQEKSELESKIVELEEKISELAENVEQAGNVGLDKIRMENTMLANRIRLLEAQVFKPKPQPHTTAQPHATAQPHTIAQPHTRTQLHTIAHNHTTAHNCTQLRTIAHNRTTAHNCTQSRNRTWVDVVVLTCAGECIGRAA